MHQTNSKRYEDSFGQCRSLNKEVHQGPQCPLSATTPSSAPIRSPMNLELASFKKSIIEGSLSLLSLER